jgi:hypothetical protein
MKKIKILKNKNVVGVTCYAYFGGIDGNGTCNTDCQWWGGYKFNNYGLCNVDTKR